MNNKISLETDLKHLHPCFVESLRFRGLSEKTIYNYSSYTDLFIRWLKERGIEEITGVSRDIIKGYWRYVTHMKKKDPEGNPMETGLRPTSRFHRLQSVGVFFTWAVKEKLLLYNPTSDMDLPKIHKGLPRDILTVSEIEKILSFCDLKRLSGLRDRAIIETFYSTGIRQKELLGLRPRDLDQDQGILKVIHTKGDRPRLVPIGERAIKWVSYYLERVSPLFNLSRHQEWLFVNYDGTRMTSINLQARIRKCLNRAKINKPGCCHLFRHSMATLMLKNGADIRILQEILGHAHLGTTQLYTHLNIEHLKAVHKQTHPAGLKPDLKEKADLREES